MFSYILISCVLNVNRNSIGTDVVVRARCDFPTYTCLFCVDSVRSAPHIAVSSIEIY